MALAKYNHRLFTKSHAKLFCARIINRVTESNIDLSIKKSSIPGADNGLFANTFIKKGTIFGKGDTYSLVNDGVMDTNEECPDEKYFYLDTIEEKVNTIVVESRGETYLMCIKDIQVGDELFRYYGYDAWHRIKIAKNHDKFKINAENEMKMIEVDYIMGIESLKSQRISRIVNVANKIMWERLHYNMAINFF